LKKIIFTNKIDGPLIIIIVVIDMRNLNFKTKILLLTLAPLVVVSILTITLAVYQAKELGNKNISSFSDKIFELRRAELKNYTEIAVTAVKHLTEKGDIEDNDTQEEVKEIIRNMSFGKDGYFYAYDKYTTLAHPKVRSLEGKNQRDMTDPQGVKIIQGLYQQAKNGGGITSYVWLKPSRKSEVEKLGYSDTLEGWDWWIGTGLYVDDLDDAVLNLKGSVDDNISTTLKLIISLALGTVFIVGLVGARITMSEGKLADSKLQELSQKSVESQEQERGRVARQLQSSVMKALNLTNTNMRYIAKYEAFDKEAKEKFILAGNALHNAMKEIIHISGELRPEILDQKGLNDATETLLYEQMNDHPNTDITYKPSETSERLHPDIEIVLYRIIQSALININEHSEANKVVIHLAIHKRKVLLSIQDNGVGFDVKRATRKSSNVGIGLMDMRIRSESLGGNFSIFSTPSIGTLIKVEIPKQVMAVNHKKKRLIEYA
jgi:two-component system NarL family sensor kinase